MGVNWCLIAAKRRESLESFPQQADSRMGLQLVGGADCWGQLSFRWGLAVTVRRVAVRQYESLMNRRRLAESVCYNETTSTPPIQFKTLLNKAHRFKTFVDHSVRMNGEGDKARTIAVIIPRANAKPRCSGCEKPRPGYDRMPRPREFEFIPVWNIPVSLSYTMRRVDCPTCGIKVEAVPWAQGKHACCDAYRHLLASWARRLSWKETAACFQTNWDTVCRLVKWGVDFGLKRCDLEDVTAIGVDEVSNSKGHKYMTPVYQINSGRKRLLGVIRDRDTQSLTSFFEYLERRAEPESKWTAPTCENPI